MKVGYRLRQALRSALSISPFADGMFRRVVWSRVHFPEHELRMLDGLPTNCFDLAIDVGAALGSYTWVLNRKARDVIAFEPGNKHFGHLSAARTLSRVHVVNAAVGNVEGHAELVTPSDTNDGRHMATLSEKNPVAGVGSARRERVEVVTIDTYLDRNFPPERRLDLLKIDVEGFENAVLAGGLERIQRDLPIIIAEVESRHNPEYRWFFDTLAEIGYHPFAYRNGAYHPFPVDDVAKQSFDGGSLSNGSVRPDGYINNFVFQHPDSVTRVVPK